MRITMWRVLPVWNAEWCICLSKTMGGRALFMSDIENEFENYLNEDAPLSEEARIILIDGAVKHRTETEGIPNLEGFTDYLLRTLMNDECLKCIRCKSNFGECNGKQGGNPCLIFEGTKVVHIK